MGNARNRTRSGVWQLVCLALMGCHESSSVTSVRVVASQTALSSGETSTLTASVIGSGQITGTVTWSIDGGGDGLSPHGATATYTASAVGTATSVVVRATSTDDASVSGSVTLTISVSAGVQVAITPVALYAGQIATLTATPTGSVPGLVWSIDNGGPGTLSSTTGTTVSYTAPANVPAGGAVLVRAASSGDATVFGTASVTLMPVQVLVSTDTSRLVPGQSIDLNGSVQGPMGENSDVTWSVLSGGGSLTAVSGSDVMYTAPPVIAETTVVLRAVPVADPTQHTDFTLVIDHGWPAVVESSPDTADNAPQETGVGVALDYTTLAVYVAGETVSGHFDIPANLGEQDGFVAKFDQYGNLEWVRQFGTPSSEFVTGIAADTSGNVYVSGYTIGRAWTPGPPGPTDFGSVGFLIAYDKDGGFKWRTDIGPFSSFNSFQCGAFGIALDTNQNIYTTGSCATQIPYGFIQRCAAAGCDAANGGELTLVGASVTPPLPFPFFQGIAVDGRGAYDLVGSTASTIQGGAGTAVGFVAQVQPNNASPLSWVATLAPTDPSKSLGLSAVMVDPGENIYVGGATDGALSGQVQQGGLDAVLAAFDSFGNPSWALQFGTANADSVAALVFDTFTAPQQLVVTGTEVSPDGTAHSAYLDFYDFQGNVLAPEVTFDGPDITAYGGGVAVADSLGNLFIGYTTGAQLGGPVPLGLHVGVQKLDSAGNPLSL